MKTIVINHLTGDVKVTKRYSNSLENPGTTIKIGNFEYGVFNFMKSDYIRSDNPVDVELAIDENHAQNVIEKTTMFFLQNLFPGVRIDFRGNAVVNFGINDIVGYRYHDNTIYINVYNLKSIADCESDFFKVIFTFLPLFNIAWQLKHNKNMELRFINKSNTSFYSDESGIEKLDIGDITIKGNNIYVIVPDDPEDVFAFIREKEFLQKFYDKVDFCEKF